MSTMTMTHIGKVSDPELSEFIKPLQQSFELSLEKAAAHLTDPVTYPMPQEESALEQIIYKRIKTLPKEKQENVKNAFTLRAKESAIERFKRLGELSRVNLKLPVLIRQQSLSLIKNTSKIDFSKLLSLAAKYGKVVAQSSETFLEGNANRTLDFRVHSVYCRDETNPEWIGDDEISLGGTALNSAATAIKIPTFEVRNDFDDGEIKEYPNGKRIISFDLQKQLGWPQTFTITLVLAEIDMGGLEDYIDWLLLAIKKEVQEYLAGIVGGVVGGVLGGPVGVIIGGFVGAIVGQAVSWLIDQIGKWVGDDVFEPVTVQITIPAANSLWEGTGLYSPKTKVDFVGHGGAYEITYDWRLNRDLEGYVSLLQGRGGGVFKEYFSKDGFAPTWSRVLTGKFTNSGVSLLFYDSTRGKAEFHQILGSQGLKLIMTHDNWRKTWTTIVPGKFSNNPLTDLMFYDANEGLIAFYKTLGDGSLQLTKELKGMRHSWSLIVPGNFTADAFTDLLFYDPVLGEAEVYKTDGNGNVILLKKLGNLRHSWSSIMCMDSSPSWLFFYDAENGEAELQMIYGNGELHKIHDYADLDRNLTQIVPGKFGGEGGLGDFLFYDIEKGLGKIYTMNIAKVELTLINSFNGDAWKGRAGMITPINFGGTSTTNLLRYRVGRPIPQVSISGPSMVEYNSAEPGTGHSQFSAITKNMASPLKFEWTIEGGRPHVDGAEGAVLTLKNLFKGTYTLRLSVQDSFGETGTASRIFQVKERTPELVH